MILSYNRTSTRGQVTLKVSTIGATLLSYQIDGTEFIDGYLSEDELQTQDGFRSAVLVPWSDRLCDGRYSSAIYKDDGVGDRPRIGQSPGPFTADHIFSAKNPKYEPGIHGLVYDKDFKVVENSSESLRLELHLESEPGYPFELLISVSFDITPDGDLVTRISAQNQSLLACPIFIGWHPYFLLDGPLGQADLRIYGSSVVETNDDLIPLPGNAAFKPIQSPAPGKVSTYADAGYTHLKNIQDIEHCNPPTGAIAFLDDRALSDFSGYAHLNTGNRSIHIYVDFGADLPLRTFHVFTGHNLKRNPLTSIAIEPCQAIVNAFNRHDVGNKLVQPGDSRQMGTLIQAQIQGSYTTTDPTRS